MSVTETDEKEEGRSLEKQIEWALKEAGKAAEKGEIDRAETLAYQAMDLAYNVDSDYRSEIRERTANIIIDAYSNEKSRKEPYLKLAEKSIKDGRFQDAERCYTLALENANYIEDEEKRNEAKKKIYEGREKLAKARAKAAQKRAKDSDYASAAILVEQAEDLANDRIQDIESRRYWKRKAGQTDEDIDKEVKKAEEDSAELRKESKKAREAIRKEAKHTPMPDDVSFAELEEEVRASYPLGFYENRRTNAYWSM